MEVAHPTVEWATVGFGSEVAGRHLHNGEADRPPSAYDLVSVVEDVLQPVLVADVGVEQVELYLHVAPGSRWRVRGCTRSDGCLRTRLRFLDAKARKNYAGTSPITRASGTRRVVLARYARNRRLGDAVHQWAFCAMRGSPGARAYYQAMRSRGIGHQAALRQLGNRLVGILHGWLKTNTSYDEATAWAHLQPAS